MKRDEEDAKKALTLESPFFALRPSRALRFRVKLVRPSIDIISPQDRVHPGKKSCQEIAL